MITKNLTILNKLVIHARPAAQFVRVSSRFQCDVTVEKDDEAVDGKSIMGLMMLNMLPLLSVQVLKQYNKLLIH
jgi:phosphocarrier protein